jgi:hypothetical protein
LILTDPIDETAIHRNAKDMKIELGYHSYEFFGLGKQDIDQLPHAVRAIASGLPCAHLHLPTR